LSPGKLLYGGKAWVTAVSSSGGKFTASVKYMEASGSKSENMIELGAKIGSMSLAPQHKLQLEEGQTCSKRVDIGRIPLPCQATTPTTKLCLSPQFVNIIIQANS
jgi:hypothetical protein